MPASTTEVPARDRTRRLPRERTIALAIAVILVVWRSLPFALFEQIQFDSDQAIFGLMAKHLSEGRAIPLFLYGSSYVLAVEAWLAAPWFLVAPINLFTLSISLILTNVAAAVLIVVGLERSAGLRPLAALVASLFFILSPPIISGEIVSVSGGNVEPFLYIALLWILRDRPGWFGVVLAVGFLQREFTIYAVPVLLAADVLRAKFADAPEIRPAPRQTIRKWLIAFVVFVAVHDTVQSLQPYADLMGPGTRGQLFQGFAGSQVDNLLGRINISAANIPSRLEGMVGIHLPRLLGAFVYENRVGHPRPWLQWLLAIAFGAAALRLIVLVLRSMRSSRLQVLERAAFAWYLLAIGVVAAGAYVAMHSVTEEYSRYGLMVVLAPVGLTAALLALEPAPLARRLTASVVIAWAAISAADTIRLYLRHAGGRPSELRVLSDALVARGVRAAYAPYWTAYTVTFMTGERVRVASTDVVRIEEYQSAALSDPQVVQIRDQPCEGGEQVARFYLCRERR
jgi:hypothetical protein